MLDLQQNLWRRMHDPALICPEQRLWSSVLLTFLIDAQRDYNKYIESLNGARGRLYNKLVTHRIVANQPHIEMVCSFVDLNHDVFVEKIVDITEGKFKLTLSPYYCTNTKHHPHHR